MSDCIRIVDYVRTRGLSSSWIYEAAGIDDTELTQAIFPRIDNAQCFVIDNVAQYFFQTSDQEYWSLLDFPNLTPVYPVMWMEFMYPPTITSEDFGVMRSTREQRRGAAVLIESAEIAACSERVERLTGISINEMKDADVRWWQSMTEFFQAGRPYGERVLWNLPVSAWFVRSDGRMWMPANRPLLRFPGLTEAAIRKHDPAGELLTVPATCMVAAFALSLLRCNRTAIQEVNPSQRMSKSFSRRHGKPLRTFRTIQIEAMQKVLEAEGSIRKSGLKVAVHVCRGHFKDYRWGGGLFGKHHGTFWWSDFERITSGRPT